jgi:hypothetical protein
MFAAVAIRLRQQGHEVLSPHETPLSASEAPWSACLREDYIALAGCEAIVLLPGWQHSEGARRELKRAVRQGQGVYLYDHATGGLCRRRS